MGVTKNDSTMKSEADQAQRKNLEVEIQQDKNEKNSTYLDELELTIKYRRGDF